VRYEIRLAVSMESGPTPAPVKVNDASSPTRGDHLLSTLLKEPQGGSTIMFCGKYAIAYAWSLKARDVHRQGGAPGSVRVLVCVGYGFGEG